MAVAAESKQRARGSQTKCRLAGGDMLAKIAKKFVERVSEANKVSNFRDL